MKICEDSTDRLPDMPDLLYCTDEDKSTEYIQFLKAIKNRNLSEIRHMLNYHLCLRTNKLVAAGTLIHEVFKNPNGIYHQQITIVDILKLFLDKGANINAKDSENHSILQLAVKHRLTLVIEFLISRKVNLTERDSFGNSILHFLIKNEAKIFVEELRTIDTSLSYLQLPNNERSIDFIRWMLLTGVDVDCQNNDGDTAFHLAAKYNLLHALPHLAKHTRDVSICNNSGMNGFQILLNSFSNLVEPNQLLPEVHIHIFFYKRDVVDGIYEIFLNMKRKLSMDAVDNNGRTPVHHLLMQRRLKLVKSILDYFTNVNAADKQGNTVLHIVIKNFQENLYPESSAEYHEVVRVLLSKGADVNQLNSDNISPLLAAIIGHKLSMLQVFKANGVEFHHVHEGKNFLHHYCSTKIRTGNESCRELFDFLKKTGCDVNAKDNLGKTALHYAARYARMKAVEGLIECGATVDAKDSVDGYTPLHEAAEHGHKKIIIILEKNRADVNAKTNKGQTALHLVKTSTKSVVVKLIRLGARIDVTDDDGFLPLHTSILRGDDKMMRKLLTFSIDTKDEFETVDVKSYMLISGFIADMIKFSQIKYMNRLKAAEQPVLHEKLTNLKSYKVSQSKSLYTLLHINRNPKCDLFSMNNSLKKFVTSLNFKKLLHTTWLSTGKRDLKKLKMNIQS